MKYAAIKTTLNAASQATRTAAIKRKCQRMNNAATPQIYPAAKLARTTVAITKNTMIKLSNAATTE